MGRFSGIATFIATTIVLTSSSITSSNPPFAPSEAEFTALISDRLFLYSDSVQDFQVQAFLDTLPGRLKDYSEQLDGETISAAEIIRFNAIRYGINPQIILVLLEVRNGILTDPSPEVPTESEQESTEETEPALYNLIARTAVSLLRSYDARRYHEEDNQVAFSNGDLTVVPTDLNPGTYALQVALAQILPQHEWERWVKGTDSLFQGRYSMWFGDSLYGLDDSISAPSSLPDGYILPFSVGETWYYTGGPHHYSGVKHCASGTPRANCPPGPWSSIDIAPPEKTTCPGGTYPARRWIVAAKGGTVVQSSQALVVVDHGDGWRTYYSHVASTDRVQQGATVNQGASIGHPSCETEPEGSTFGVHVHFAIWQMNVGFVDIAGSTLSSWVISETTHYNGTMSRNNEIRTANTGRLIGTNDISNDPYSDDFDSTTLDAKWYWIREDPTHWSLADSPGYLRMITQPKDIWRQNDSAPVLLQTLRPFTADAFEIRTRVVISPVANFHQGGLVIYGDDDNYVRFTYAYIDGPTFEFAKEINGDFQPIQVPAPPNINDFHLRLVKQGQNFYGYYSQYGTDWILIGQHLNVDTPTSAIGLLAFNAEDVTLLEIPADFDHFQMIDHHRLYLPVVVR